MRLVDLRDLLLTIGPPVFHYFADKQKGNYIVWAEDGEGDSLDADDKKEIQSLQGTIDYFTKTEHDPVFELIQQKLDSADISWSLNSVQYEEDTSYIHYEWLWEVDGIG
ncbi:hypothetical protein [Clostridium thermarum]|uniref:hypothetical protein n=1 Tax=Clostridium thermarum TaxID=1716543 RepID=UPI0011204897|nr:hypothetical protein [Clostridium thermarum]